MQMHQYQGFYIRKFLLHETGTYNEQYRRPYNTHLDGGTMTAISERLADANSFSAPMMGGIANQFISPTATPEKMIEVPNGWGERRMRFMMEVEVEMYTGGRVTEVILGWTNYKGVGMSGSIDPQMEFYVNSTLQVRQTMANTPLGMQQYSSVIDNSHILVDPKWTGIYDQNTDNRLRPEDVFATMSRTHLPNNIGTIRDGRTAQMNTAVKSRRGNGSAANYMASILRDYKNASADSELGQGEQELLSKARGFSQENLAANDHFLAALSNIRGMGIQNVFQFKDLQALDPNVEHATKVSFMGDTQRTRVHEAGQTANWGASDRETAVATILSQAIPALLMDLAMTKLSFQSTNQDIGSQIHTIILDAKGFSNADLSPLIEQFKNRLSYEILRDVTYDNQVGFMLEMHVDLLGETWIRLSLDGGPMMEYVTPSFCDALLVPVLTNNNELAVQLASDFEMLATSISDMATERHPSMMSAGGSAFGNI